MQAHQIWFDPIPSYPEDMPEAFRGWYDPERPDWLDLTVARFLKLGLTDLYKAINVDSLPGVTWSSPWIQAVTVLPWRQKPQSEALRDDIQRLMIEKPSGPFEELGGTFTTLTRVRAIEYLTRYSGAVIQNPNTENATASAIILDRVLEQEFLLAMHDRKATQADFLKRLLSVYSIGLEDDAETDPLLPDKRSRAHAKELNRVNAAFRPHLGVRGASMALAFQPTVVIPEQGKSISTFWFGLRLSEAMRRKAEATRGECFEKALHKQVDKLIGWTSRMLPGGLMNRFRTAAEVRAREVHAGKHVRESGVSMPLSPELMEQLRDGLGISLIQEDIAEVKEAVNRPGALSMSVSALPAPSRPGKHAEGKAQYRDFLKAKERNQGLTRMFRAFREECPWAKTQPPEELDRLRQTIERNKLHKKYWNEISDIRKQTPSRKSSRKRSRGKR